MLRSTLVWPAPPVTLAFQGVTLSFSSSFVYSLKVFTLKDSSGVFKDPYGVRGGSRRVAVQVQRRLHLLRRLVKSGL